MIRALFIVLVLASLALGLPACVTEPSDSVDQDRIFQSLELFYNKNEDKTYAVAAFKFGNGLGTLLQLSDKSEITFDGKDIPYNSSLGWYQLEMTGLVSSGTFVFTDHNGKTFSSKTPEMVAIDFPETDLIAKRGQDFTLSWQGTKLGNKENVGLLVGIKPFLQLASGTTSITLGGVQLNDLTAGPYVGIMDRYSITDPDEVTSAGGIMTVKYRTLNKTITITD